MDQKNTEKIDIERCKELFEYEMTEVVLMLKGEFAAVSGKDLGYSQHHVSEKKRNAPLAVIAEEHIKPVQIQLACISADIPAKIAAQRELCNKSANAAAQVNVSGVVINKPDIGLPYMPSEKIKYAVQPLQMEPLSTFAIPKEIKGSNKEIPAPEYDLPEVQLPETLSVPAVAIATVPIKHSEMSVPKIPHFNVNLPVEDFVPSCVKIPDMTKCADCISSFDFDWQAEKMVVKERLLDGVPVVAVPAVSIPLVTSRDININVPKIERYPVSGVENKPEANRVAVTPPAAVANKCSVAEKLNEVCESISELGLGKKPEFPVGISVPEKRRINISAVVNVCLVDEMKVVFPDVPRHDFQHERKSICVRQLSDIMVPSKPDTQKEIDEILTAVFN